MLPGNRGRPVTVAQSATSWLARDDGPAALAVRRVRGRAARRPGRGRDRARPRRPGPGAPVLHGAEATADARSAGWPARSTCSTCRRTAATPSENPLFSGFELADGPWFGYDIDQLTAVPDVVLLSACEVGRSTLRGGEELIGMTAAWLHAGPAA